MSEKEESEKLTSDEKERQESSFSGFSQLFAYINAKN
jgi:hypothetical protein